MLMRICFILTAVLFVVADGAYATDAINAPAGTSVEKPAEAQADAATAEEAAYTRTLEKRAADILALVGLKDEAKEKVLRDAVISQYRFVSAWHETNDAQVKELSRKNDDAAKAKIEELKVPLRVQHARFIKLLEANLTDEQIEKVKNYIVKDKLPVTYKAYCDMLPQLTAEQKAKVYEILEQGREEAMDAGSSEEKTLIFGRYKGKVNIYLSGLGINLKEAEKEWRARREAAAGRSASDKAPTSDVKKKVSIPAFPGAEGFGAVTAGGRGGKVIEVTSLDDSGPGTFRAACEAEGPRIVVFRVAGIIRLNRPVSIEHPFITIAGQSAPGDGVCIAGETTLIDTHDVIIRYMRFRRGAVDQARRDDALGGQPKGRVIIDHCSASWGLDENLSIYRHMESVPGQAQQQKMGTEDVTIQWCTTTEALNKFNHAFGATQGGTRASIHHNLYACNTARNPSIGYGDGIDWRNNVVFNWQHRTVDGGDATSVVNVVNNYYKPGPATRANVARRICRPQHLVWASAPDSSPKWYVAGNFVVGAPEVTADNRKGIDYDDAPRGFDEAKYEQLKKAAISDKEWKAAPVTTQSAEEAYELVLKGAGATLPVRDAVDARVIESVRTGEPKVGDNGIIIAPNDAGGYPEYKSGPVASDGDHDGMPDEWEKKYRLDPKDAADGAKDNDKDGYTNVEEYLNGTDPTQFVDYSKPENNVNTLRK